MARYAFPYGAFCIDALPNQPQIAHCHSFFIHEAYRGQGKARLLKQAQLDVLRTEGYNYAQCTTAGDNLRQHRVLERCGWKRLIEFSNSAKGGTTIVWGWEVVAAPMPTNATEQTEEAAA